MSPLALPAAGYREQRLRFDPLAPLAEHIFRCASLTSRSYDAVSRFDKAAGRVRGNARRCDCVPVWRQVIP